MDNTKRYIYTLLTVIAIVASGRGWFNSGSALPSSASANLPSASPSQSSASSSPPNNSSNPRGIWRDGTYTGQSADAYYGNVQVKIAISGGKISNVALLDYPQDNQNSQRINSYAIPQLQSEAISTQSRQVDAVSGASFTSQAFNRSLASALAQAS